MNKWYLQTWFISVVFLLSYFVIPIFIGIILLIMHYKAYKPVIQKYKDIEDATDYCNKLRLDAKAEHDMIKESVAALANQKSELQQELDSIRADVFLEYSTPYIDDERVSSEECKNQLSLLKVQENELIKSGQGIQVIDVTVPKKVMNNNVKQLLRCFNSEANEIMSSVNVKNVDTLRGKLQKSFDTLNKIFETDKVALSSELLKLKLTQLTLLHSYQLKKEQERLEQKAIREQMVEEEKVRREIEREKAKIEKEESQFKNEITKLVSYLQKANDVEKQLYVDKIKELEEKLKLVEKDKDNVLQREQNTRAGYVYIISNIGSFGEDVYKIGMTRRLEPMDRVQELGDASVPFEFDVHAMIFSEDAPTLESTLHTVFRAYELNKVNHRKEFFRVPLDEIEAVVKKNHNATVTFTKVAKATQYRESLALQTAASNV